jgi:glycosyltransferase involved in cell wall biosynthesis
MSNEPTVSVIIPTYNRAGLLPSAIQSVLDQTYKNYEIIVIDDGSTDNTKEVIKPYLDHITFLEADHGGPAHARNIGMKAAKGKYISFLDSDDLLIPYKLEMQVKFIETHPEVALVSTEVSAFDESGVLEEYHLKNYHIIYKRLDLYYEDIYNIKGTFECDAAKNKIQYFIGNVFDYVLRGTLIMSTTVLIMKDILDKVGYQNEKYLYAQEYDLIVRICKSYDVAFLNVPTYLIRYHDEQHSMSQGITKRNKRLPKKIQMKKGLIRAEASKYILQTVLDYGKGDAVYYQKNREWLDRRIAEIYHDIGEALLNIGVTIKARDFFLKGISCDVRYKKNHLGWRWSFCPVIIRRVLRAITVRIFKNDSIDFYI